MSWNNLPAWDKNRPIFFQIGMVTALILANIAINYEHPRPDYSDFIFEDIDSKLSIAEIQNHLEPPEPKPQKLIQKVNPMVSNIIINDQTIVGKTEYIEKIRDDVTTSGFTDAVGGDETVKIVLNKPDPPVTPTLTITEQMPFLANCDVQISEDDRRKCTQSTMLAHIYKNLKYPAIARETGVEGTVILSFVIDKNGKLINLEIIRDIGAGCGAAAVKVISNLGNWVPGKHNHQAVNVKYTIPIKFKLEN